MKYKISLDGQSSEQTESDFSFELCGPCIMAREDEWTDVRPPKPGGSSPWAPPRRGEQLIDF